MLGSQNLFNFHSSSHFSYLIATSHICVRLSILYHFSLHTAIGVFSSVILGLMDADGAGHQPPIVNPVHTFQGSPMISLPIFGLAAYKFKSSVWMPNAASERHLANSLLQAADNWLRLLRVVHPDFQFFASHGVLRS